MVAIGADGVIDVGFGVAGGVDEFNELFALAFIEGAAEKFFDVEIDDAVGGGDGGFGEVLFRVPAGFEVCVLGSQVGGAGLFAGGGELAGAEVGGEVVTGKEGAGVDPRTAAVPAFDGGCIEEFLAHGF